MVVRVSSGSPFEQKIGYSRAVVDDDMVYVSGTTGYDYAKMEMPESVSEQTRNALINVENALRNAGASLQDVVRVRYYLTERDYAEDLISEVGKVFGDIRPAATMVIAQLMEDAMKVEIEVTARKGAHRS